MRSRWDEGEAANLAGDLAQRVYSSRLLGRDPSLVLHGGGNTSVKVRETDLLGEEEDILYVKGSGWDLASIEPAGFSPVRLGRLRALAGLPELSDLRMATELRAAMTNPLAPSPSVEAILHAILPYRYVDHTHADAFIALCNTPHGEEHVRDALGDDVLIVPYVMPGFKLASLCARLIPRHLTSDTIGLALLNHGLFTWGETARESYERMIDLVDRAERYLKRKDAWEIEVREAGEPAISRTKIAELRHDVSRALGAPAILATYRDPLSLQFAQRDDVSVVSQQGPATPDHVIRTKRLPLLGTDVESFAREYERYFAENASHAGGATMLDPSPRVILDPRFGMIAVGRSASDAHIAADIYRHTIDIITRATALESYRALPPEDIFDVEYWDLEQAKLRSGGRMPSMVGEVVLITGAASGIGRACVDAFLREGAAVVALDRDARVEGMETRPDLLGLQCDVTDEQALAEALDRAVLTYGGLDMLVLNAGVFPGGQPIAELDMDAWRRVQRVNVDANAALLRLAHPLLRLAPRAGRVVVVGSKNVPAPGPGAAAYSASKAALTQLARVSAMEWGKDGIRVNVVHPNAVFDTGIWTPEVLEARARSYGLTVDQYRRNNVLGVEVTSRDVADLVVTLCGPAFARTTGAQIPIDGGNDRVI